MIDQLEEIKAKHQGPIRFYQRVQPDDLTWLIEQVESSRKQIAQMSREIVAAHQVLDELGVPNDGKSLLAERLRQMGDSSYTPVAEALTTLYETWCKLGSCADETIKATSRLLEAYDDWLD